jgi:hypothetical protein
MIDLTGTVWKSKSGKSILDVVKGKYRSRKKVSAFWKNRRSLRLNWRQMKCLDSCE